MAKATTGLFLYSGAGRSTAGGMVCDEAPGHLVVSHQEVDRCDSADDEHRTADDPEQGRHLLPPPPKVDARPRRQEEDEERDDGASCVVGVHVLVALWVRQSGGQDSGDEGPSFTRAPGAAGDTGKREMNTSATKVHPAGGNEGFLTPKEIADELGLSAASYRKIRRAFRVYEETGSGRSPSASRPSGTRRSSSRTLPPSSVFSGFANPAF